MQTPVLVFCNFSTRFQVEPDLKKINETVIQNYIHVHVHCNLDYNQVEDINVKSLPTLYTYQAYSHEFENVAF